MPDCQHLPVLRRRFLLHKIHRRRHVFKQEAVEVPVEEPLELAGAVAGLVHDPRAACEERLDALQVALQQGQQLLQVVDVVLAQKEFELLRILAES